MLRGVFCMMTNYVCSGNVAGVAGSLSSFDAKDEMFSGYVVSILFLLVRTMGTTLCIVIVCASLIGQLLAGNGVRTVTSGKLGLTRLKVSGRGATVYNL